MFEFFVDIISVMDIFNTFNTKQNNNVYYFKTIYKQGVKNPIKTVVDNISLF